MDLPHAATRDPDPDAVEFIRFCYGRRRVGWPELYDEMCAVAARGLFRGLGSDDLAAYGIGFSLFDMPALAAMANGVVAQEQARRRPVAVILKAADDEAIERPAAPAPVAATPTATPSTSAETASSPEQPRSTAGRLAPVTLGA